MPPKSGAVRLMNSGVLHHLPEPGFGNSLEPGIWRLEPLVVAWSWLPRGAVDGAKARDKVSARRAWLTCDHRRATCRGQYIPQPPDSPLRLSFLRAISPRSHALPPIRTDTHKTYTDTPTPVLHAHDPVVLPHRWSSTARLAQLSSGQVKP